MSQPHSPVRIFDAWQRTAFHPVFPFLSIPFPSDRNQEGFRISALNRMRQMAIWQAVNAKGKDQAMGR